MMAPRQLLIIASDPHLRHSLEFALEAEGYDVTSCGKINEADSPERYACVILDHRAVAAPTDDVLSFCKRASPIVLLTGVPLPWLSRLVFQVVQKPLLGEPLSRAVREALISRHACSS